jgi:rhamnosyltransferase
MLQWVGRFRRLDARIEVPVVFRVCAIVVAFNPDLDRLRVVLDKLTSQVERIVIVDNGSANLGGLGALVAGLSNGVLLAARRNLGVGAALNRGVEVARAAEFDAVLLMDQDSIPSVTLVSDLVNTLQYVSSVGRRVAAIGPRFVDRHSGNLSQHVVFSGWRIKRVECGASSESVEVDFLITSGSLIPMSTLRVVGVFDEKLFIDHVDTEWVLRARSQGFHAYGDCSATMEHDLGEFRQRIWLGRRREIPIHKPFRYYYIVRNSLLLRRLPHASAVWRRVDAIRLVKVAVFMALFHPQRMTVCHMMIHGLRDGLRGRTGKRNVEM